MDRGCEWPAQPGCDGKVRILSVVGQASVCGGRLPGGLGENGETGLELVLGDEEGLFLKPFGEEFVQGLEHDRFGRPASRSAMLASSSASKSLNLILISEDMSVPPTKHFHFALYVGVMRFGRQ